MKPIEIIRHKVAEAHGLTIADLESPDRRRKLAWARQEAYWLAKELTGMGDMAIGHWFNRDHTTLVYGIRAYKARQFGTVGGMQHAFNIRLDCLRAIEAAKVAA